MMVALALFVQASTVKHMARPVIKEAMAVTYVAMAMIL
jgi:hypothetical protein